jgi:hypothetical protein
VFACAVEIGHACSGLRLRSSLVLRESSSIRLTQMKLTAKTDCMRRTIYRCLMPFASGLLRTEMTTGCVSPSVDMKESIYFQSHGNALPGKHAVVMDHRPRVGAVITQVASAFGFLHTV